MQTIIPVCCSNPSGGLCHPSLDLLEGWSLRAALSPAKRNSEVPTLLDPQLVLSPKLVLRRLRGQASLAAMPRARATAAHSDLAHSQVDTSQVGLKTTSPIPGGLTVVAWNVGIQDTQLSKANWRTGPLGSTLGQVVHLLEHVSPDVLLLQDLPWQGRSVLEGGLGRLGFGRLLCSLSQNHPISTAVASLSQDSEMEGSKKIFFRNRAVLKVSEDPSSTAAASLSPNTLFDSCQPPHPPSSRGPPRQSSIVGVRTPRHQPQTGRGVGADSNTGLQPARQPQLLGVHQGPWLLACNPEGIVVFSVGARKWRRDHRAGLLESRTGPGDSGATSGN